MSAEYDRRRAGVNRGWPPDVAKFIRPHFRRLGPGGPTAAAIGLACVAGLAAPGCVSTPARPAPRVTVAVWYDLDTRFAAPAAAGNAAADNAAAEIPAANTPTKATDGILAANFETARRLGFDTILLRRTESDPAAAAASAQSLGRSLGLHVACESPLGSQFVNEGRIDDADTSVEAAAGIVMKEARGGPVLVSAGISEAARKRCADLCAAVAGLGGTIWPTRASILVADLALIRCLDRDAVLPPERRSEAWLGRFHAELAAGHTGGVVFDRFRRRPGVGDGITDAAGRLSPRDAAAVKAVVDRARRWCDRLAGAAVISKRDDIAAENPQLRIVWFQAGAARYVMIFNASEEAFIRTTVTLAAGPEAVGISRLVEVTPDAQLPGAVHHARASGLAAPIDLRPGDAALFEAF